MIEKERRFLFDPMFVLQNPESWRASKIVQGYLFSKKGSIGRVRKEVGIHNLSAEYVFTVKNDIDHMTVEEINVSIDEDAANSLLISCDSQICKIRYHLKGHLDPDMLWTVDVFTGPLLNGLCIAELEAGKEDTDIMNTELIPGVLEEITGNKDYSNFALSHSIKTVEEIGANK